jgi:predicted secreted protein
MIRRFALALLFILVAIFAAAGDIAMFENLGFSQDARVFLFGQYGIDARTSAPFAEVFAVDVPSNSFVSGGKLTSETATDSGEVEPLSLGQDGRGALFQLVGEARDLIQRYDVNHLNNGRPIYILVDGDQPKQRIAFRDFNTNTRYEFVLNQEQNSVGDSVEASFHIELTVTDSEDRTWSSTIGRPGYYRSDIQQYRITQVLLSPDENALVIVVEKKTAGGSIRYMVETATLN